MIFNYNSNLDINLISKLVKLKKYKILDFGCGIGSWSNKNIRSNRIQSIILYDKNKNLIKILKKKYKQKKIKINFNFKKILREKDYNLIVMSSVAQYMTFYNLRKLLMKIVFKKNVFVIITDIPKYFRLIEFFLLPIFNINRFIFSLKMIGNSKYRKLKYISHSRKDFLSLDDKFKVRFSKNINDLNFLRYSVILRLK